MVERLGTEQQAELLRKLTAEIKRSPLLAGLDVQVRSGRGRFYVERRLDQGPELWARITPLAEGGQLLLERERRQNRWYGVARGGAKKLIAAIAGDTVGTFHGLGSIDASLREAGSCSWRSSLPASHLSMSPAGPFARLRKRCFITSASRWRC